jgi:hypothetical protein
MFGKMDTALAAIGGMFFISMVASYWLDHRRPALRERKRFSVDGLIRFLGIVGLIAMICAAFGIGSWLVSLVYWFVIEGVFG